MSRLIARLPSAVHWLAQDDRSLGTLLFVVVPPLATVVFIGMAGTGGMV